MNSHGSYSHQEQEKDIRSGIEIQNVSHTTNHIIGDVNRLVVLDDCTCIIVNHLEQSRNVHIEEGVLVIKPRRKRRTFVSSNRENSSKGRLGSISSLGAVLI